MGVHRIVRNMDEVPEDMSEQEEIRYWLTHSLSLELMDEVALGDDEVDLRKKNSSFHSEIFW